MNALITHCKKKGKGLHKKHLTDLRTSFYHLSIEENELKDGFSYFSSWNETECTDWENSI